MSTLDADVAIIGAGPAGAALALALARAGRRVLLAERAAQPRCQVGESVAPPIRVALERLGVWGAFAADGHLESLGNESAWGQPQVASRDFLFSPYGNGWHLERARFDAMLVEQAVRHGAQLRRGVALEQVRRRAGGWDLRLAGTDGALDWRARLLVDASGRRAAVARRCGQVPRLHDHLAGAVRYYASGQPVRRVTLVEAAPGGWWYSAPLPERRLVVVYMSEAGPGRMPAAAPDPLEAPLTCERLACHGGAADGTVTLVPAYSACLERAAGDAWLALGDAAASFDPLSSQGIQSALEQALTGCVALDATLDGDDRALAAYAQTHTARYQAYLDQRRSYYRLERRWPTSHFWRQRWEL